MKTMNTLKNLTLVALFGAALAAPVMAQQGQGMGGGAGQGPSVQNAAPGQGMGPGMGQRGGRGIPEGFLLAETVAAHGVHEGCRFTLQA